MTIQLIHQIQSAERGLVVADHTADPRFVPSAGFSPRDAVAAVIRSSARSSLRLADRLSPEPKPRFAA